MLAIHIGAGNHDRRKTTNYKKLIAQALNANQTIFPTSLIIERSPLTNTGYGSSLNLIGEVECDASIIIATKNSVLLKSLVGIDDCMYPITATSQIFADYESMYSQTKMKEFGITMPMKLNYQSYSRFRKYQETTSKNDLVTNGAQTFYNTFEPQIMGETSSLNLEQIPLDDSCLSFYTNEVADTIGLIEINHDQTTIATSLGGNFFKLPGRIGCAGEIGSSIDFSRNSANGIEISCVCSGNGEDIMQMKLSNYIVNNFNIDDNDNWGENLVNLIQTHLVKYNLYGKSKINDDSILYIGLIVIINDTKNHSKRLIYCHSTESFYFGFRTDQNNRPNIVLSHLDNAFKVGKVFAYGEFKC